MLRAYYEIDYEYPPEQHHCLHHHHHNHNQRAAAVNEESVYGSDEFRMYAFKIKRCSRTRSHDWTECPFAHRGEKAQRRDPRKFEYWAVACPAFRNGRCIKGDTCEFAHGVFEYWLHPARYRTRPCNAGRFCQRKVCFFAHSPDQLRPETKYRIRPASACRVRVPARGVIGGDKPLVVGAATTTCAAPATTPPQSPGAYMIMGSPSMEGVTEFLRSLRSLKITDQPDIDVSVSDLPEIEWVSDLVEGDHNDRKICGY